MQNQYVPSWPRFLAASFVLIWLIASCISASARESTPEAAIPQASFPTRDPSNPWLIIDTAFVFNQPALDRFQFDLRRAQAQDLPVIIYIRRANETTQQSQLFADELREAWNVETSEGADDGLVMLLTINTAPSMSSLLLSWGANALPNHQLTREMMDQVYQEKMMPLFRTGDYFSAFSWGLRRIVYYLEYSAPEIPELSNNQQRVSDLMSWWAYALPVVTLATLVLSIAWRERRLTPRLMPFTLLTWLAISIPITAVSLAVAVYGRSPVGTLSALSCLLAILILSAVLHYLQASKTSTPDKTIRVSRRGRRQHLTRPVANDG